MTCFQGIRFCAFLYNIYNIMIGVFILEMHGKCVWLRKLEPPLEIVRTAVMNDGVNSLTTVGIIRASNARNRLE